MSELPTTLGGISSNILRLRCGKTTKICSLSSKSAVADYVLVQQELMHGIKELRHES